MANPRKFSEKIALQKQKQAEGTAEFERIMKEVHQTKMDETQVNQKILEYCLRSGGNTAPATSSNNGGSGNGVGGGGGGGTGVVNNDNLLNKSVDKQIINDNKNEEVVAAASAAAVTETQLITTEGGVEGTPLATGGSSPLQTIGRESRVRSVGVGPIRRPSDRKQDRSPYGSTTFANATNVATNSNIGVNHMNNTNFYLSPPQDTNWRRSNSDSALHQSLNMAVNAEIQSGMNTMLPIGDVNNVNVVNVGQHSPHMVRRLSANQAAMRRKAVPTTNMQQQQQQQQIQQQQQQHNYHMLQQQQQQRQLQHAMQQQQHIQEQQQQQHYVTQQQQQHQQQHQQQQLHFNSNKFLNCNSTLSPINNSFFKTFSDQSFGSLPDLSSVHFNGSGNNTTTTATAPRAQQLQILSPLTIDYHDQPQQRERTPSPYIEQQQQHSPNFAQNTQVVAPPQYTQSTTVSFGNLCTSSEMKNEPLTVCISLNQNHNAQQQQQPVEQLMRSNLPTLGAASSAGNLTEYRQPLNPPSPGSSPGLLTSASGNELHMSAPSSPIRYMPNNSTTTGGSATTNNTSMQGGNLIQTFDNVFGGGGRGGNNDVLSTSSHFDNNNSYHQFHNHFEHFTLGDSNSSPDQHQQTYLDLTHDFGIDYGNMVDDDLTPDLTINELTAAAANNLTSADLNATSDATNLYNVVNDEHHNKDNDVNILKKNQHDDSRQQHNYQQQQQHKNKQTSYSQRKHQEQQQQQQLQSQQQQQQRLINKTTAAAATTTKSNNYNQNTDNIINNNNNNNHLNNNETAQQQQHNIDTTTANIVGLINSPTSPMPIPLPAAQSPIHQQQQHHAHSPHMQQQSPLHSPLTIQQQHMQQRYHQSQNKNTAQQQQQQSPHHTTANTTTTTTDTSMNTIGSHHNSPMSSPLHSPASSVAYNGNSKLLNNVELHHHHQQQQQQQHHQHQQHNQQQQQQQQQFNQLLNDGTQTQPQTTTTTNIPSIIFSDYSSNADIFDGFDIETLGSMDDVGLQMISEQNSIIITDPNIEDSFRRDFN